MNDPKAIIALCSLFVAICGFTWTVNRDTSRQAQVVVTSNQAPAPEAELITYDGAQFSVSQQTGFAYLPKSYIGYLVIVRNTVTRKEVTRFTLKSGLNEVSF